MSDSLLETARTQYENGEFELSAESFTKALKERSEFLGVGERGYAWHMIGNCHMKQHRFEAAIVAYQEALGDEGYPKRGALCVNLGKARMGLGQYDVAAQCFNTALNDKGYSTPYKALMALGDAQLKIGDPTAAGTSYRNAALEKNNPNPAKSLVNLGVCFMALDRPSDAVESYVTALRFKTDDSSRAMTYANLGQAYVATGRMNEAVQAFENALAVPGYSLSKAAFIDYDRAKRSLEEEAASDSGLDNFDSPFAAEPASKTLPREEPSLESEPAQVTSIIPPADDTGFFSMSEDEMNRAGKAQQKAERKKKNTGLKAILVLVVIVVLLVATAAVAYFKGFGYPLQETVVTDMFTAYSQDQPVDQYWADASEADLSAAMASVAKTSDVVVDAVQRDMNSSVAYVTATLPEGGQVQYVVNLARDGLSWKITGIGIDFASRDY